MSSQLDRFAFADVCGNGLTGNAGYYARMGRSTQFDNPPVFPSINSISASNLLPKRLEYSTYENRLESYNRPEWPKDCPVTPQLLSAAGLFYHGNFLGNMDSTECYYCGSGLCLWENGDDPWSEHQRVSPQCPFLNDIRNKKTYESQKNKSSSVEQVTKQLESVQISDFNGRKTNCERLTCKVCLEEEISVLFLPCAHLISCPRCAVNVTKCPLCRSPIHEKIKTYI